MKFFFRVNLIARRAAYDFVSFIYDVQVFCHRCMRSGKFEMIPSTPKADIFLISTGSLTVQAKTFSPEACAFVMKRFVTVRKLGLIAYAPSHFALRIGKKNVVAYTGAMRTSGRI